MDECNEGFLIILGPQLQQPRSEMLEELWRKLGRMPKEEDLRKAHFQASVNLFHTCGHGNQDRGRKTPHPQCS